MAAVNAHLAALHGSYLFSEIGRRVTAFSQERPEKKLLRMGIGDVTRPIAPAVLEALIRAAEEMGRKESFHGYAPANGYPFLIDAIRETEYTPWGVSLAFEDVFVSDGSKSDSANLQELFSDRAVVAVCDPVYPVYADSNQMAGRKILRLPCVENAGFVPALPECPVDFIYLCNPNNPTGMAMTRDQLTAWVNYAREADAAILYDAAYQAYITNPDIPHSIFEIEGAKEVAVECGSLSKSAGFTGLRCAWTIVPHENRWGFNALWARRVATKFNGVAYPIQRAAEAALLHNGRAQSNANIRYYMENARVLGEALQESGLRVYGGVNAPYLWVRCPDGLDGWTWFDVLLAEKGIICTPGEGFGACGAGYVRFSSFGSREEVLEAVGRIALPVGVLM